MSELQVLDPVDELEEIGGSKWSWQGLIKPSITVAVGLHLLLLIVPIVGSQSQEAAKPKTPEPQDEKVKLTTLSADTVLGSPAPSSASPKAQASDGVKPSPTGAPSPTANKIPEPKLSAAPSPKASASPSPSSPKPSPSSLSPSPSPSASKPSPSSPSPSPSASNAAASAIPAYPKGTKGAFGIPELAPIAGGAQQTTDDVATVEKYYKGILPSKGFTINVSENSDTKKTFEVASKVGASQFLTLFSVPQGTVIVTSTKPLPQNLADTAQQSVEEKEFDDIFTAGNGTPYSASGSGYKENMFVAQSNQFEPENPKMLGVQFIPNQTEEQAYSAFAGVFQAKSFQVTKGGYGGSVLVTVTKGTVTRYFSLVAATPAKPDGAGVYVVGWKTSP
jgi:hypothetical protein